MKKLVSKYDSFGNLVIIYKHHEQLKIFLSKIYKLKLTIEKHQKTQTKGNSTKH